MKVYCTRCWTDNDASARYCRRCGADLQAQQREDEQLCFSEKLVRALHHGTPDIPVIAAQILGERRDRHALEPLMALIADPEGEPYAREAAAHALAKIGDQRAVPALIAALDHPGFLIVRLAAAESLAHLGGADAASHLARVASDGRENEQIREIAAAALPRGGA